MRPPLDVCATRLYIIIVMPKLVDHDERRRAIADAAVQAIATHGLEDVKLTQIARMADVTTGAVTHYFESKDDVLLAALEEVCRRLFDAFEERDERPPLDQLFDILPADALSLAEWKVWIAFWGRAAFAPRLAGVHRDYYVAIQDALAQTVGGEPEDARTTADAIMAAIDGIGVRVCLEPELWPPERQRAVLVRLLAPLLSPVKGKAHADA
jgi:TetR/AcrR family transcriptional regulator, transcriptional repressor of bet genes